MKGTPRARREEVTSAQRATPQKSRGAWPSTWREAITSAPPKVIPVPGGVRRKGRDGPNPPGPTAMADDEGAPAAPRVISDVVGVG